MKGRKLEREREAFHAFQYCGPTKIFIISWLVCVCDVCPSALRARLSMCVCVYVCPCVRVCVSVSVCKVQMVAKYKVSAVTGRGSEP